MAKARVPYFTIVLAVFCGNLLWGKVVQAAEPVGAALRLSCTAGKSKRFEIALPAQLKQLPVGSVTKVYQGYVDPSEQKGPMLRAKVTRGEPAQIEERLIEYEVGAKDIKLYTVYLHGYCGISLVVPVTGPVRGTEQCEFEDSRALTCKAIP